MTSSDESKRELLLHERNALREEILLRIRQQHELLALTWVAFGLVIAFADGIKLLLLYQVLSTFTAASWQHNGARTVQLKTYLRDDLEPQLLGPIGGGWERALAGMRVQGFLGACWFVSTKGLFFGTQTLVTLLAISRSPEWFAIAFLIAVQIATAIVLRYPRIVRAA